MFTSQWFRRKKAKVICWWWERASARELEHQALNFILTVSSGKEAVDVIKPLLNHEHTQTDVVIEKVLEALEDMPFAVLSHHTARLEALLETSDLVGEEAFALTVLVSCGKYLISKKGS